MNDALVGLRRYDTPHIDRAGPGEGDPRGASRQAEPGDIVILAGKGHEPYQVLKDRDHPFRRSRGGARRSAELGLWKR